MGMTQAGLGRRCRAYNAAVHNVGEHIVCIVLAYNMQRQRKNKHATWNSLSRPYDSASWAVRAPFGTVEALAWLNTDAVNVDTYNARRGVRASRETSEPSARRQYFVVAVPWGARPLSQRA